MFGDADHNWVATRRIWNQHAYHIGNVDEDGRIPADETPSWTTHNTYRLNAQTSAPAQAAPDLVADDVVTFIDGCLGSVSAWVRNVTLTGRCSEASLSVSAILERAVGLLHDSANAGEAGMRIARRRSIAA